MKYYNLSEGNFKTGKLPENEMWEAFHWLFSDKSVNDSSLWLPYVPEHWH